VSWSLIGHRDRSSPRKSCRDLFVVYGRR